VTWAELRVDGVPKAARRFRTLTGWTKALSEDFAQASLSAKIQSLSVSIRLRSAEAGPHCYLAIEASAEHLPAAEELFERAVREVGLTPELPRPKPSPPFPPEILEVERTEIRYEFEASSKSNLRVHSLSAFVLKHLDDDEAHGSLQWGSRPARHLKALGTAAWARALDEGVDGGYLSGKFEHGSFSISLNHSNNDLSCTLSLKVEEQSLASGRALLELAMAELNLGTERPQRGFSAHSSTTGEFALPDDAPGPVHSLVEHARTFTRADRAEFEYTVESEPHIQHRTRSVDEGLRVLSTRWQELANWTLELHGAKRQIVIRYSGEGRIVRVEVADDDRAAHEFLTADVVKLGMTVAAPAVEHDREVRYLIAEGTATPGWATLMLKTVLGLVGQRVYASATATSAPGASESDQPGERKTRNFENLDHWLKDVHDSWPELVGFSLWITGRLGRITADVDLIREIVMVTVRPTRAVPADRWLQELASTLKLGPLPRDLYRYRSFKHTYAFEDWQGDAIFAERMREGIAWTFQKPDAEQVARPGSGRPKRDPRLEVTQAYVTYGTGEERLESFATLEEFYARLGKGTRIMSAAVAMDSRHGHYLRVTVDLAKKELVLAGNLDHARFKQLASYLEETLILRLKRAERSESESASKHTLRDWLPALAGALGAAMIAGVFSTVSVLRDAPKLELTPAVAAGTTFVVAKQPLTLSWCLSVPHFVRPNSADCSATARVIVRRRGAAEVTMDAFRVGSIALKNLPTGVYDVRVQVGDTAPSSMVMEVPAATP
jgi:hypothetical protein